MSRPTNQELNELKVKIDSLVKEGSDLCVNLQECEEKARKSTDDIEALRVNSSVETSEIKVRNEKSKALLDRITELTSEAKSNSDSTQELSDQSDKLSDVIATQESQLNELICQSVELNKKIEDLLPGATSAGLASAFRERKESFYVTKILWGFNFVVSILCLLLVAFIDPISFEKATLTHKTIFPYIFVRLPFVIPIIWLAIYSGRRHSQALRLEEDYAHKEVLSKSFEGYKNQLLEIEGESGEKSATLSLIDRTLSALSLHPGRIYQGKHEDISPFSAVKDVLSRNKSADE